MTKPTIDLGLIETSHLFGIIVPGPSGVLWKSQVGGTYCAHPQIEGIYIPLVGRPPEKDPLCDWALPYDVGRVWHFLNAAGMTEEFTPVKDAVLPRFAGSEEAPLHLFEAWVPVTIANPCINHALLPLKGRWGVLVYPNSD